MDLCQDMLVFANRDFTQGKVGVLNVMSIMF